jgi:hypothetical protein
VCGRGQGEGVARDAQQQQHPGSAPALHMRAGGVGYGMRGLLLCLHIWGLAQQRCRRAAGATWGQPW